MRIERTLLWIFVAASLALTGQAQGPIYDKVIVDLPDRVKINDQVLTAGKYEIRQVPSSGAASRIMLVSQDGATQFETSATSIPTLKNQPPSETQVILQRVGQNYYLDKIWVSGKSYGYEFPLPVEAKGASREQMEPVTVSAEYKPAEAPVVAQARPAPEPPKEEKAPAPQPQVQATPEPQPAPAPAPEAAPAPQPAPAPVRMPRTSAGWLTMLAGGAALSSIGFLLKKRS
jgi:hypothetical protein